MGRPGTVKGDKRTVPLSLGLKWLVPGSMAGNKPGTTIYGTWELVINTAKDQIVHWLFKPNKK